MGTPHFRRQPSTTVELTDLDKLCIHFLREHTFRAALLKSDPIAFDRLNTLTYRKDNL